MEPAPPLSEAERARGRRLAITSNVAAMVFVIAFTEQLPTLALVSLGASETLIGLQSGLVRALFVLQLPALRLVSWFPKRTLLVAGHAISLAASLPLIFFATLRAFEPSVAIPLVFASLFLTAVGVSLGELVWFPLLRGYMEPARIGRFFGAIRTSWHVAVIAYFAVGQLWLGGHPGAFGALFALGWGIGLLRLPLIARMPERSERSAERIRAREAIALVRREPLLRRYLLGTTAFAAIRLSVLPFALVMLRRELGFADSTVVLTTVALYLGGLASLYLWGSLIDRLGAFVVFRLSALVSAGLYVGLALLADSGAATLPAAIAFFFLQSVFAAGFGVADTRVLFELAPPEAPARTIVAASVVLGAVCGLVPALVGAALDGLLARTTAPLDVYRGFFLVAAALQALSFLPLRAFRDPIPAALTSPPGSA